MCNKNKKLGDEEAQNMSDSDFSDNSDVSMSDSESDSDQEINNEILEQQEEVDSTEDNNEEEEEEDEVIKKIREENERKSDHPPTIICEQFVTDICFHPSEDLLAVADIVGDVILYKYTNEETTLIKTLELHTKSCRDVEFSEDGKILFSTSKDKTVMLSDVESGNLIKFFEDAHEVPINCLRVIDENVFATGDDDGTIKLWDRRDNTPILRTKKNEDYISDMVTNEAKKYLICSSGDGSLTTLDLHNRRFFMQTEEYDEELTCLGLFKSETKVLACSSKGKLYLYNWNEFGLHSDAFPGIKSSINALVPITENIVVTATEDGNLRATHLFPHRHLGIVGQHDLSIEHLDISNNGQFIASSSHNNDIKFWNIKYFEDFEKVSSKHKKHLTKKELENNLPSSKFKNGSDFFSDLA